MSIKNSKVTANQSVNGLNYFAKISGISSLSAGGLFFSAVIINLQTGNSINEFFDLNGADILNIVHTFDSASIVTKTILSTCAISIGTFLIGRNLGMKLENK